MKILQTSMCCLVAAALLVHSGCAKKKEKTDKTVGTSLDNDPLAKNDKKSTKSDGAGTNVKKSGNTTVKGNGIKSGQGTKHAGRKTPVEAAKPVAKNGGVKKTVDPPLGKNTKKKVESGSSTVRKIRGPKIGDQD